ncbi:MAG: hypothetical protein ABIT01_03085 [Thermoanaerobaculia bacterium]
MFVFDCMYSQSGSGVWNIQARVDDPLIGDLAPSFGRVVTDESGQQVVDVGQLLTVLDVSNDMLHLVMTVTPALPERLRAPLLDEAAALLGRHVRGTGASLTPSLSYYDAAETWLPLKLKMEGGTPDA